MTSANSDGRWASCRRGSAPCWCCARADLPVAEVADVLSCSAGTVTSTASRAAARLAEVLTYDESYPAGRAARRP
jgi:hypothetical protein